MSQLSAACLLMCQRALQIQLERSRSSLLEAKRLGDLKAVGVWGSLVQEYELAKDQVDAALAPPKQDTRR